MSTDEVAPAVLLRALQPGDLLALVALNNAAAPAVPVEDEPSLARLTSLASLALVAEADGAPAGFLLALDPGADYASENYRWFSARSAASARSFLYIDRVVLGEQMRGRGVGRRLYEAVFARAAADLRDEVDCEVNTWPPNPASLAFHAAMGFGRVGEQSTKGGSVQVALLAADVSDHRIAQRGPDRQSGVGTAGAADALHPE